MRLTVSGWGNSLGLRIPKSITELLGIKAGSQLEAKLKGSQLILSPLQKPAPLKAMARGVNLKKMISKVSKRNRHLLNDEAPAGREVW